MGRKPRKLNTRKETILNLLSFVIIGRILQPIDSREDELSLQFNYNIFLELSDDILRGRRE
jgi:hypothetical protein